MIYEVEGDILLTKAQAIAHGVCVNDPMNVGLALALHNLYPAMHKDYHHWCHQHRPEPGDAWLWSGTNGVRIVNLITQQGIDNHDHRLGKATVKNVTGALKTLVKIINKEQLTSIALPRLATGVGGLEWQDVKPVIESTLGQLDIPVYVYTTYRAGQTADETLL